MKATLLPVSCSRRKAAEKSSPEGSRCLVENCTNRYAVHLVHVFDREISKKGDMISAIEWNWGLEKGTLNLDTRSNMFFLGASLHELYKQRKWALLPEEAIVNQYFKVDNPFVAMYRSQFPNITGSNDAGANPTHTFRYTLIPIHDMEDISIIRQPDHPIATINEPVSHVFPFESMPIITSHIHPKFVILKLGYLIMVSGIPQASRRITLQRFPLLRRIVLLFEQWKAKPPSNAHMNPTYCTSFDTYDKYDENADVVVAQDSSRHVNSSYLFGMSPIQGDQETASDTPPATPPKRLRTHSEPTRKPRKIEKKYGERCMVRLRPFDSQSAPPTQALPPIFYAAGWGAKKISKWANHVSKLSSDDTPVAARSGYSGDFA